MNLRPRLFLRQSAFDTAIREEAIRLADKMIAMRVSLYSENQECLNAAIAAEFGVDAKFIGTHFERGSYTFERMKRALRAFADAVWEQRREA